MFTLIAIASAKSIIVFMGICRFCNQDKKLIDAHIIPWFFYKHLIPKGETYEPFVLINMGFEQRRSKGSYDKNILCSQCDNFLGALDEYAARTFKVENIDLKKTNLGVLKNSDYKKVGYFILSVIWRASISTLKEFDKVTLGVYEHDVKNILIEVLNGKNPDVFEYFIVINRDVTLPANLVEKNIMLPFSYKFHGVNVTQMILPGGFKIVMKFDKRKFPQAIQNFLEQGFGNKEIFCLVDTSFSKSREFQYMIDMTK